MVQNLEVDGREFFSRQVDMLEEESLVNMSESLARVLEALREEERGGPAWHQQERQPQPPANSSAHLPARPIRS